MMLNLKSLTLLTSSLALLVGGSAAVPSPRQAAHVGYLAVHFYDREPSVFFKLSNGTNPLAWTNLNNDNAILVPTLGSRGARDPHLVAVPDESKYWIIATDLNIASSNWEEATRRGSRSIFVWESTDLVNWSNHRLVNVMGSQAGMVWAPEAVWDPREGQFLVHWASRLYSVNDPGHTGAAITHDEIWSSYTSDFITFTEPKPYIRFDNTGVIDLTFLQHPETDRWTRFVKNVTNLYVWQEESSTGLFGTWQRTTSNYIDSGVISEGPLVFWDIQTPSRAHLWLDQYTTARGYVPFSTNDVISGSWSKDSLSGFPSLVKHGVVVPLTQEQYDSVRRAYSG